jgi:general secretion pathway protein C
MIAVVPKLRNAPTMPITTVFDRTRWTSLAASFLSAAVLCGVIAYWAMILSAPRIAIAPAGSLIDRGAPSDLGPAQRLFGQIAGAAAASATAATNITVIGIVASTRNGSAILAIDGKPARPVGVGEELEPGLKLTSVSATEVVLERDGVKLRLPAPAGADPEVLTRGADPAGPGPDVTAPVSATPAAAPAPPASAPSAPAAAPARAPVVAPAATAPLGPTGLSTAGTMIQRTIKRSRSRSSSDEE